MRSGVALLAATLALAGAAQAGAGTPRWPAWLCRPGLKTNWCNTDLSTTVILADGSKQVVNVPGTKPPIDCFYVYPTVSEERRGNADLKVQNTEEAAVLDQAARFSQVCRVFAPVYRQTTAYSSSGAATGSSDVAYASVLAAWRDYLAHWNDGRGVVLIGHSQGAFMLERLISEEYDSMRHILVSALLLGGDVAVGQDGRYAGLSPCGSLSQTGCIVAYSTWNRTPPADASLQSVPSSSDHVLCVNPAAPGGGSAVVTPIFPWFLPEGLLPGPLSPRPSTIWVALLNMYSVRCVQQGTRSWLLVTAVKTSDARPKIKPILAPQMGLHAADVNIALGALINLVRGETKAYLQTH